MAECEPEEGQRGKEKETQTLSALMLRQSAAAAPAAPGPALQAARGSSGAARGEHRCWDVASEVDYFLEEFLLCRKAPRKSSGRHKLVLWTVGGLCLVQRGRSQEHLCACPDPPQSCAYKGLKSDPGAAELLPGLVDVSRTLKDSVPGPLISCRVLRTPAGHQKGAGAESCLRHCGTARLVRRRALCRPARWKRKCLRP